MKKRLLAAAWLLAVCLRSVGAADDAILRDLLSLGVPLAGGGTVRLPTFTMPDGLGAQAQTQAIEKIADDNHPLAALLRKSVVAPFVLHIHELPAQGPARPRQVDFWFVAFGDPKRLSDEEYLKEIVELESTSQGNSASTENRTLSDSDLRSRKIAPQPDERYLAARFTLFDRVDLSGIMRAILSRGEGTTIVAAELDPRFSRDPEFPNSWRPISRDEAGGALT